MSENSTSIWTDLGFKLKAHGALLAVLGKAYPAEVGS